MDRTVAMPCGYGRRMALARFKDICFDVADAAAVATYWAKVLGQRIELQENGDASIHGPAFMRVWFNQVPEPKASKNRVHLDLEVNDAAMLVALGATVLSETDDWWVLADPEGNEFCASPGEPDPAMAQVFALCVDCERPVELAAWWQSILGGQLVPAPDGTPRWLLGAGGLGDLAWKFIPVPEARAAKNRVHWDVTARSVQSLVDAGASLVREEDDGISWTILADPEGNEFCVFPQR
jgi:catechol 2,3-dioxygenase-like lactoylglutathione lyase family enzyme